jgi:MarR family transcriptional regulator, organic hydroperoxide resistance regulator
MKPGKLSVAPGSRSARADAKQRGDPAFPDFKIADWPFYLMTRTAGRYALDMEHALRRIDLDLASWRGLMLVHETNPSSVSEIADRAVMRLSTMTRVVQRLETRGLVTLARRESDARVTEVCITNAGERAVSQIRKVASRIYHLAFGDFEATEVATLNALLRRVFDNLDATLPL